MCDHNYILEETIKGKNSRESYNFNYWHNTIYKKFRCTKCLHQQTIQDGIENDYTARH